MDKKIIREMYQRNLAKTYHYIRYRNAVLDSLDKIIIPYLPIEISNTIHTFRDTSDENILDINTIRKIVGYDMIATPDYYPTTKRNTFLDDLCEQNNIFTHQILIKCGCDEDLWKAVLFFRPSMYENAPPSIKDRPYFRKRYYTFKLNWIAHLELHALDTYSEDDDLNDTNDTNKIILRGFKYLAHGANVHVGGNWMLRFTTAYGTMNQVKVLVEKYKADINYIQGFNTGIIIKSFLGMTKYLKRQKIDTSIWRACRFQRAAILKYLLSKGGNPHLLGNLAFRFAIQHACKDILDLLYEYQQKPLDISTQQLIYIRNKNISRVSRLSK